MSASPAATYIEVLMLDGADPVDAAHRIGRACITPCHAVDAHLDAMQQLRFYHSLVAFLLGVAEGTVGADGREAIVQCMRNVGASACRGH